MDAAAVFVSTAPFSIGTATEGAAAMAAGAATSQGIAEAYLVMNEEETDMTSPKSQANWNPRPTTGTSAYALRVGTGASSS